MEESGRGTEVRVSGKEDREEGKRESVWRVDSDKLGRARRTGGGQTEGRKEGRREYVSVEVSGTGRGDREVQTGREMIKRDQLRTDRGTGQGRRGQREGRTGHKAVEGPLNDTGREARGG